MRTQTTTQPNKAKQTNFFPFIFHQFRNCSQFCKEDKNVCAQENIEEVKTGLKLVSKTFTHKNCLSMAELDVVGEQAGGWVRVTLVEAATLFCYSAIFVQNKTKLIVLNKTESF